jgi:glutaredoxin
MQVTVYTKDTYCSFCEKAKSLLTMKNIPFTELKLNEDFTRDTLVEAFPSAKTFPIIVVDGFNIGGYDQLVEHISKNADSRKFLSEGL